MGGGSKTKGETNMHVEDMKQKQDVMLRQLEHMNQHMEQMQRQMREMQERLLKREEENRAYYGEQDVI